jgi:hypothetical protein
MMGGLENGPRGLPKSTGAGVWGLRPQRVQGGALATLDETGLPTGIPRTTA